MKAVAQVLVAPGRFAKRAIELVEPGPGQVAMRVLGCGLCGSDKLLSRTSDPGTILGHEVLARVDVAGPGVAEWQPGDRAVPLGEGLGMTASGGGFSDRIVVSTRTLV